MWEGQILGPRFLQTVWENPQKGLFDRTHTPCSHLPFP